MVGAVRNAPSVITNRLRSSDGRRVTSFTLRLASTPFTVGPVGRTGGAIRILEREGDHIIGAFNVAGANTESADRLEQESAGGEEYGTVGYTHARGGWTGRWRRTRGATWWCRT
jgi:hypothetical protein